MPQPTSLLRRHAAIFCFAILAVSSIGPANWSLAAVVGDCRLVMDGSSDPPGDRVVCSVGLLPDDRPARIELRAYQIGTAAGQPTVRVKAGGQKNRDAKGDLLIAADLATDQAEAETSLVVPYADLSLPPGQYMIGYVVALRVKDQVVWTQALPATLLRVTEKVRDHIRPQMVGNEVNVMPGATKAYVGGKLIESDQQRLSLDHRPGANVTFDAKPAAIPGGFERAPMKANTQPATGTSGKQQELGGLAGQPWQPLSNVAGPRERVVYFATNRKPEPETPGGSGKLRFGSELADAVTLGKCSVNFPVRHSRGELLTPSWWTTSDPEQYFLIDSTEKLTADELKKQFGDRDVLLFVHGYSNTFEDAVLRTGQLQYDVEFPGSALAFCWPADGALSTDAYKADVQNAEKSVRALSDLIESLTESAAAASPPAKVHVIAHSLGNRLFLASLHDLVQRNVWKAGEKHLGQVVLAAPDIGAARFNNVIGYATGAAERLTYYYCRSDKALTLSQSINYYEPVGLYPYFEAGLDTINADGVGTDFISHSYYGSSPRVLADLHLVFCSSYSPDKRMPPLSSHSTVYGHEHWSFMPVVIEEQ